ncbi:expressed protein, partial [Chlorella variabilis]
TSSGGPAAGPWPWDSCHHGNTDERRRFQDHPRAGQPRVVHPLRRGWAANRGGGRAQAQPSPRLHLRVPSRLGDQGLQGYD